MNLWPFTRVPRTPPAIERKPDLAEFLVELSVGRKATLANAVCYGALAGEHADLNQILRTAYARVIQQRDELWQARKAGDLLFQDLPSERDAFLDAIDDAAYRLASKDARCADLVRMLSTRMLLD